MPGKRNRDVTPAMKAIELYGLLLFTRRAYSLSQLAQRLGCSKQTVLRRIEEIEGARRLPVQIASELRDRERHFWAIHPDPPPNTALTPESIQMLSLCRDIVLQLLPPAVRNDVDAAIQGAASLVPGANPPEPAYASFAAAHGKGVVDYSGFEDIIQTLFRAIREHRIVEAAYTAHDRNEPKRYAIAPLRLITYHDALYIKARLEKALDDPDSYFDPLLAVHRFNEVELTDRLFTPPKDDGAATVKTFGFMLGDPFRVRIRAAARVAPYLRERIWSDDQQFTDLPDGELELEFTATNKEEVDSWVAGFLGQVEIVEGKSRRIRGCRR